MLSISKDISYTNIYMKQKLKNGNITIYINNEIKIKKLIKKIAYYY